MTPDDLLTFKGITQPISEHALDYGITPEIIIARLERGVSVDEAITTPMEAAPGQRLPSPKFDPRALLYTHDGLTMPVKQWAARSGVKYTTLRNRLKLGVPFADAIIKDKRPTKNYPVHTHDGLTLTLAEWSKRTGIPRSTLSERLRLGMTIGEAITMPRRRRKKAERTPAQPISTPIPSEGITLTADINGLHLTLTIAPGVGQNFGASERTGGHSTKQDRPEIKFHNNGIAE